MPDTFDMLVVGGGVNGCGIARDAAGRGFSVLLTERGDLGGATSSASSKLIHGGLRYLEHRAFRLVREALAEREVLLRIAPHIIRPMRFVLPHRPEMRPRWMIRAGLFLYDHLARRVSLPGAEVFRTRDDPRAAPLRPEITSAFAYSDAWVEDSRLVVLNARDAAQRGARVLVRTALVSARRGADTWTCTLRSAEGVEQEVRARVLVNAAGPWVEQALGIAGLRAPPDASGSCAAATSSCPPLYEGEHAFILQNDDGRVVFVIPYEGAFSLVGTTDVPHEGDPAEARCTDEEAAYLCAAVGRQFRRAPTAGGDRVALFRRAPAPRRRRRRSLRGVPRLFAVAGQGRQRRGAGAVGVRRQDHHLPPPRGGSDGPPRAASWRRRAHTLDRDRAAAGRRSRRPGPPRLRARMAERHPWLPPPVLRRLARSYGSELEALLGGATSPADLGQDFGGGLTERELEWLRSEEWARTADDVLWRRTRLGLHLSASQRDAVAERFQASKRGS